LGIATGVLQRIVLGETALTSQGHGLPCAQFAALAKVTRPSPVLIKVTILIFAPRPPLVSHHGAPYNAALFLTRTIATFYLGSLSRDALSFSSTLSRIDQAEDIVEHIVVAAIGQELKGLGVAHRSLLRLD